MNLTSEFGVGMWKEVFSRTDREKFLHTAGDLLRELGYVT